MSTFIALTARATLIWIFAAAIGSKLSSRARLRAFVEALPPLGLPARVPARIAAALVIGGEASALAALFVAPRLGAAIAAALLVVFTLALAGAVRGNRRAACHCFGTSDAPVGRIHLWRNAVLLAISGAALFTLGTSSGALELSATRAAAVGHGLLIGFLVTRWDDLAFLAGATLTLPDRADHLDHRPGAR